MHARRGEKGGLLGPGCYALVHAKIMAVKIPRMAMCNIVAVVFRSSNLLVEFPPPTTASFATSKYSRKLCMACAPLPPSRLPARCCLLCFLFSPKQRWVRHDRTTVSTLSEQERTDLVGSFFGRVWSKGPSRIR